MVKVKKAVKKPGEAAPKEESVQPWQITDEAKSVIAFNKNDSNFKLTVDAEVLVSTQQFENARMRVGIEIPIDPASIDEAYEAITGWLSVKLTAFEEAMRG